MTTADVANWLIDHLLDFQIWLERFDNRLSWLSVAAAVIALLLLEVFKPKRA